MRGSKGGFWDRLMARIRQRKIQKKKEKLHLIEEKMINSKKEKTIKQKETQQVLYILNINNKLESKSNKKSFKLRKKGISAKIITSPQGYIKNSKEVIIKKESINKKKDVISPKFKNKNISSITKKKITKKKKGIPSSVIITTKDNTKHLNEKTQKLIAELNKIIDDNRENINEITSQISKIRNELHGATSIKKVEEIEQKLMGLKRKLIEFMENYSSIKNGSYLKLNKERIEELITEIKKINPTFKFSDIVDKVSPNLDYYNDLSNNTINTVSMIYSASYQKDIINYKNNKEQNMDIELSDYSKINNKLSQELDKHKNIINEFNALINKISAKKIVSVQNDFLSTMLHNTGCLISTFLSIPFLRKPKNIPLFTFGLFTINNSIRNMRKVTTTENISYIPSDDYANKIIKYKNSFGFVDYMISDSLCQIRELKEEYKINFSSFHNSDEFNKNLMRINSIEEKILRQSKAINELKNKYEKALDKNYEKVLSIKNTK